MTGPGRPPIGPVREVRIPDDLWELVTNEACEEGVTNAGLVRLILAAHFSR